MYKRIAGAESIRAHRGARGAGRPLRQAARERAAPARRREIRLTCELLGIAQIERKRTQIELPNPNGNKKQPIKSFVEMLHVKFAAVNAGPDELAHAAINPAMLMKLVSRNAKRGAQTHPSGHTTLAPALSQSRRRPDRNPRIYSIPSTQPKPLEIYFLLAKLSPLLFLQQETSEMHPTIRVGEMSVTFIKTRHETAGAFDLFELTIPPFARNTIPHIHRKYDETILASTAPWFGLSTTNPVRFAVASPSSFRAEHPISTRTVATSPPAYSVCRLQESWGRSTTSKSPLTFTPMVRTWPASQP